MSYNDPDNKDIMKAIEKIQKQCNDPDNKGIMRAIEKIQTQVEQLQESNRLFSKIQTQVEQLQESNLKAIEKIQKQCNDPDNKGIMRAIEKIQTQVEQLQESNRLFSPEHIAQVIGFVAIKSDLNEIKQTLLDLSNRIMLGK